jgi:putative nucleotidyltransferase with HDIG domain
MIAVMVAVLTRTTAAALPVQPSLRKRLEQHLRELPVLPEVIVELMRLRPEAPRFFEDVQRLVEVEPAFSTRLLAAANSAASAPRQPILGVRTALQRIGSRSAAELLLATAVTNVFVPRDEWAKALWRHSLEVAVLARSLAAREGADPEHAYTCGLLHDVGRFILLSEAPEQLRAVEETPWTTPELLVAAERTICGLTHAELGALACRKWRLPEAVAQVVADHHAPQRCRSPLARAVVLADALMFDSVRTEGHASHEPIDPTLLAAGTEHAAAVERARSEAASLVEALGVG